MPADVIWPSELLKPTSGKAKVMAATTGGGRSLSGLEQVVASDAGFWRMTLANILVRSNDAVRVWNAIEATLQGRSGTVMVPALDYMRAPWPVENGAVVMACSGENGFSDGTLFSDGTGFSETIIEAEMAGAVAARGTSGRLRIIRGSAVKAGMHWQAGDWMYRVMRVIDAVEESAGVFVYDVTFWPPAREAIAEDEVLEFDDPRFRARLETDDEMDFDPQVLRHGRPSLNFVEDVV